MLLLLVVYLMLTFPNFASQLMSTLQQDQNRLFAKTYIYTKTSTKPK